MNSETNKLPDNWMFYADVVAKTEFKLYNIMPGINFQNRIQYHCHKRKIAGYIIYSPDGQRAIGVMEGFQKNINRIKDWILRRCIPEPFHHRVIFSSYEMSFNPNKELFHEKYTVPKGATFLGDLYESYFDECELESEEESQEEEEDEDPIESLGEYAGFFTENSGLDCDDTTSDTTMTTESLNNDYDGDEDTTTETTTTDDDTTIETTEPDEDSTTETTEPHYETSTESTEPHYATSTESTDHHYEATTESTEPDDETTTEPTSSDDDSSYTFLAV